MLFACAGLRMPFGALGSLEWMEKMGLYILHPFWTDAEESIQIRHSIHRPTRMQKDLL